MEYKKAAPVKLRDVGRDEKWLQERIYEDPSILGLGDLGVFRREKIQYRAGRIDFVFHEIEDETSRYETEIMLGTLNESHIIRAIEYWDLERRRYPNLEHKAVIIAEDITNRFFNVISLMNKSIPIIAIQLSAFRFENALFLNFVKVLDLTETWDEEEAYQDKTDRKYWENRSSSQSMAIMDSVIQLIKPMAQPNLVYNKGHVAVNTSGQHFMFCHPRKGPNLLIRLRITEDRDNLIARFEERGIECKKGARATIVRINVTMKELEQNRELFADAICLAENYSH